jgi:hypothetical protein
MKTNKSDSIQTVRVELLAPAPRTRPADAKELLRKMVEKQVAEIMSRREDFLLHPFFDQAKVSNEIKRLQTVPEQRKWAMYFARYGCLRCQARSVPHSQCGMCAACVSLTRGRLRGILDRCERDSRNLPEFSDRDEQARLALAPALKELNAAKHAGRTTRTDPRSPIVR